MQPENGEDIPFLEKPNAEEIEKNIIESTLVLCISLNEKEVASLFGPYHYFLSVNRYMYLSNLVPKCIEHFKSFILPLYGNQCGVYFETEVNRKKRHGDSNEYALVKDRRRESEDSSRLETSTLTKGNEEERNLYEDKQKKREQEYIVLDWRLPIGVLFDIYCEFEVSSGEDEDENEDEQEKEEEDEKGNEMGKGRIKSNAVFCQSGEIVEDCYSIVKCSNHEQNTENKQELKKEFTFNESVESIKPFYDFQKKENKEPAKHREKKNSVKFYRLIQKNHIRSPWYEQKFENMSKQNIPWKLRVCFKSEREYCHWDLMNSSQKSLVDKINLLPYNNCIPLYKGIYNFEEFLINQLIKASYIYKRSNRYIQKLPNQTEKEILFHLKNFNVEKICALYRQCINFNLIKSIDYFNNILEEHFSSNKKWRKRNTETNVDFNTRTYADVNINSKTSIDIENNGLNRNDKNEHAEVSTFSKSSEKKEGSSDAINNIDTIKKKNDIKNNSGDHGDTKTHKQNRLFDLLKDEKAIEELPIVIHIYGPPYNQVVTKFQPFKIKMEENDKNKIEEFYAYTLGDFLHVQFPTFFRKVTEKTTIKKEKEKTEKEKKEEKTEKEKKEEKEQIIIDCEKEKGTDKTKDKNIDNETSEQKTDEAMTEEGNTPYLCVNDISYKELKNVREGEVETVYYFKEDNFLIFSEYIFVIINGIQIPLSTPLYWLSMNFSQFDNFLHIILRVPPY